MKNVGFHLLCDLYLFTLKKSLTTNYFFFLHSINKRAHPILSEDKYFLKSIKKQLHYREFYRDSVETLKMVLEGVRFG